MTNNKTLGICALSITALILLLANLVPTPPSASAANTLKDRDYSVVTATAIQGGETLYVTDNRAGLMAAFVWDPNVRGLSVRDVKSIADAFQ